MHFLLHFSVSLENADMTNDIRLEIECFYFKAALPVYKSHAITHLGYAYVLQDAA